MYFRWLTFEVINDINKKNEIKNRQDMKELEERIENKQRLVRDELKKEIQILSENTVYRTYPFVISLLVYLANDFKSIIRNIIKYITGIKPRDKAEGQTPRLRDRTREKRGSCN